MNLRSAVHYGRPLSIDPLLGLGAGPANSPIRDTGPLVDGASLRFVRLK